MRRHFWSKLVMLLVVVLLLGAVPAAAFAGFADVPADAWYAPAVQTCAEKGLFQGTSPTTFSPELSVTRGMFVTVLGRMENIDPTQADASGFMTFRRTPIMRAMSAGLRAAESLQAFRIQCLNRNAASVVRKSARLCTVIWFGRTFLSKPYRLRNLRMMRRLPSGQRNRCMCAAARGSSAA